MAEYIDREAAIKAIKGLESATSFDFNEGLISAMNVVDEIQSEDVQHVVHGRWICHDDELLGFTTECSVCHAEGMLDGYYCPNCGARMDGEA